MHKFSICWHLVRRAHFEFKVFNIVPLSPVPFMYDAPVSATCSVLQVLVRHWIKVGNKFTDVVSEVQ